MSMSYEVYVFRNENWTIDSVYDDREMALYEARLLIEGHGIQAVRVVEERFDEGSGEMDASIIFRQQRDPSKTPAENASLADGGSLGTSILLAVATLAAVAVVYKILN